MIKNILKQCGVTLSQFSGDLSISRPTLDNYIETYDKGQKISNNFYHDIFDFLFENPNINDSEFIKRYQYMKDHYGMTSNDPLVTFSKLKSSYSLPKGEYNETILEIKEIIDNDMINPDTPLSIYKLFLNAIKLKSDDFNIFYQFYVYYNGHEKLVSLNDEQKKLYSYLHQAYQFYLDQNKELDKQLFEQFTEYSNKAFATKQHQIEQIKEVITDKLSEVITDQLKKGDLSQIDINEIIDLIKKKI